MGEIVDLDAFRKRREKEEEAKAKAEAEAKAAEEQEEIDYMQEVLSRIILGIGDLVSGSMIQYTHEDYSDWSSDDYVLNTYYHEAGYDEDGYYERSWEFDPRENEDDEDI